MDKTIKTVLLLLTSYLVVFSIYYLTVIAPSQTNYQSVLDEFEAQFPLPAITKSFQSYTSPPWVVSQNQIDTPAKFLQIANGEDLFAIYKEKDYWDRGTIYYVAVSPADHSGFIMVYEYRPKVRDIDNGFFKPKTYEIV